MRVKIIVAAILCLLAPLSSVADVVDSAGNGFTVKITTEIHAAPAEVYNKLVHNVGDWWSADHTFSGDSHNLSIEEKTTGCFCEKLANGGGVRHAEVMMFAPGKALVLSGAFGPFQKLGAAAALSFVITPTADGSKLELDYAVGGYMPGGFDAVAPMVNSVLTEQVTRLKNLVETGTPASAAEALKH